MSGKAYTGDAAKLRQGAQPANRPTWHSWRDGDGQEHKETEWHIVVAWGKLAEACNQYLHKGSLVYVEGRLHTRQWEDDQQVKHRRTE